MYYDMKYGLLFLTYLRPFQGRVNVALNPRATPACGWFALGWYVLPFQDRNLKTLNLYLTVFTIYFFKSKD